MQPLPDSHGAGGRNRTGTGLVSPRDFKGHNEVGSSVIERDYESTIQLYSCTLSHSIALILKECQLRLDWIDDYNQNYNQAEPEKLQTSARPT